MKYRHSPKEVVLFESIHLNSNRIAVLCTTFLAIIFYFFPYQSWSQPNSLDKKGWTIHPIEWGDLPRTHVNDIHQDLHGFLWIATQHGALKFDGKKFYRFPFGVDSLGFSKQDIVSIAESPDGTLWFASSTTGLLQFEPSTRKLTPHRHNATDSNSIVSDRLTKIIIDQTGELWIGSTSGSLSKFDESTGNFSHYNFVTENRSENSYSFSIHDMIEDDSGNLWLATFQHGILHFDTISKVFSRVLEPSLSPYPNFRSISLAKDSIWAGTLDGGLFVIDPISGNSRIIKDAITSDAKIDISQIGTHIHVKNDLWIGTRNQGILHQTSGQNQFIQYDLNSNKDLTSKHGILVIEEDQSNVVWVGTSGGLFRILPNKFHHLPPIQLGDGTIDDIEILPIIHGPDGKIWMGTDGNGVLSFDPYTGEYFSYTSDSSELTNNTVYSMVLDSSALWVATYGGGLNRLDLNTLRFSHFLHDPQNTSSLSSNWIWPLIRARNGDLWLGAMGKGVQRFDPLSKRFELFGMEHGLTNIQISSLLEDVDGKIWIGTIGGGLNVLDPISKRIISYRYSLEDQSTLSSDNIFTLFKDSNSNLWVGTTDGGLNRFNSQNGTFTRYLHSDRLPSNQIFSIQEDNNGYLWIATDVGLVRFSPSDGSIDHFDANDGLHGDDFRVSGPLKRRGDYMFFGGYGGVTYFIPEEINSFNYNPPVQLTGVYLYGDPLKLDTPYHLTDRIKLSHTESSIDFTFASLDFHTPEKNKYEYFLENWDSNWIPNDTSNFAPYRSLPPGKYVFHARGTNRVGHWSNHTLSVELHIVPPFYQQGWFYALVAFIIGGLAFSFYKYRMQKAVELERIRYDIASDLHEEIGADLSVIIQDIKELVENGIPHDQHTHLLSGILSTVQGTFHSVRETIWVIDPNNDRDGDIIERMRLMPDKMFKKEAHTFNIRIEKPENVVIKDLKKRQHVLRAYKEILHNIYKHAQASQVDIDVSTENNFLVISVKDDGVGFHTDGKKDGYGLRSLDRHAKETNGKLVISSSPSAGTHVIFYARMDG